MIRFTWLMIFLLSSSAGATQAPTAEPQSVTVEGEIVDIGCYAAREAKGAEHQSCAARCLKNGNPAGLLDTEGHVFTLAAAAPAFTDFAAQKVRIVGSVRGSLLRPKEMFVWGDGAWQAVELTANGAPKVAAAN